MTEDKDRFYLEHILEAISNIDSFLTNKTKNDFLNNKMLQNAVIKELENIGEASKRISSSKKSQSPDTAWRDIAGIRDILVHDYFGIDLESVWNTVEINIPELKNAINELLK